MKVIGYARVSTEDKAKEDVSLEAQRARIEEYCFAKSWKLLRVEADKGVSAKDMEPAGVATVFRRNSSARR